ncbi:MAG: hypothetical protein JW808_01305, partial [Victivallales bacterium]|nr:hypothetical protein [Victivallales bacterium]
SIADIAAHGPEGDSSFNARYRGWINGIPKIMERPIFGHGVGSIPLATYDCQYVRELHETGIVGTIVFLYMNLAILAAALSLFYMSDDSLTKGLACGFMGGHVGKLVHAWSIENFYTIMNMEVFWFVVALLMILYNNHLNRLEAASQEEPLPMQPDLFGGD